MAAGRCRAVLVLVLLAFLRLCAFCARGRIIPVSYTHLIANVIPGPVVEYFNPMVLSAVLRVYAEQLAIARSHPLTQRRYMWKLEY